MIVYVDTETTGLDPDHCQALQVGILIDTDGVGDLGSMPNFETLIKWPLICGEPYALHMNAHLLKRLSDGEGCANDLIGDLMCQFFTDNKIYPKTRLCLGGKNVAGFDLPFLCKMRGFRRNGVTSYNGNQNFIFDHRIVDPGSMWMRPGDKAPPGLATCLERAGYDTSVAHTALADCYAVAKCVRAFMNRGA